MTAPPDAAQRVRRSPRTPLVVGVVAAGGMVGASARYALSLAAPTQTGALPWTTLAINAVGSLLIGVLMVFVVEVGGAHPLLRPFVGVGVLGGFTTFSTYAVEVTSLLRTGHVVTAGAYLAATPLAALGGVALGVVLTRWVLSTRPRSALRGGSR